MPEVTVSVGVSKEITYPNVPVVKFYEPKSRHITESLDKDLHTLDRQYATYRHARNTLSHASRCLIQDILTMCNADRKVSYQYYINSIFNSLRHLPAPYCNIVEPKVKPSEFKGTLFES